MKDPTVHGSNPPALYRLCVAMARAVKPGGLAALRLGARGGLVLVLALALGALFTGCGGSSDNGVADKSAQEILQASKEAATSASSVHVVGRSSQGSLTLAINLSLTSNGGRGRVSFLGLDYEVVRIGGTVYVKGSPAFYNRLSTVLGKAVNVPAGTWLKASADTGPLVQLGAFADLRGELNRVLSTPGVVTKGASTTIKGQNVIELREKTKVYKGVLYVATTGKPYPVVLIKTGGREKGRSIFSEWNEPLSVTAPSPVVDIGRLERR